MLHAADVIVSRRTLAEVSSMGEIANLQNTSGTDINCAWVKVHMHNAGVVQFADSLLELSDVAIF